MSKSKKISDFTTISVKSDTAEKIKALNLVDISNKKKLVKLYETIEDIVSRECLSKKI